MYNNNAQGSVLCVYCSFYEGDLGGGGVFPIHDGSIFNRFLFVLLPYLRCFRWPSMVRNDVYQKKEIKKTSAYIYGSVYLCFIL